MIPAFDPDASAQINVFVDGSFSIITPTCPSLTKTSPGCAWFQLDCGIVVPTSLKQPTGLHWKPFFVPLSTTQDANGLQSTPLATSFVGTYGSCPLVPLCS